MMLSKMEVYYSANIDNYWDQKAVWGYINS